MLSFVIGTSIGALPAGCDRDDEETAGDRFCQAVAAQTDSCAEASACEMAMVSDCGQIAGLFNDAYLDAAAVCVDGGEGVGTCLGSSRSAVTRSAAHEAFADALCENCALGVSGCKDKLFASDDSELAVAGALIDPLGDALVTKLTEECASGGLTCLPKFPSCAQGVLAEQIPTETAECLVTQLIGGGAPSACGSPSDTGSESESDG